MIRDEDRARLGGLAMKALDTVAADYGDEVELGDAVLVFEVRGETVDEVRIESTAERAVVSVGLLDLAYTVITTPAEEDE